MNNLEPRELSSWQGRDGTDAGAHGGLWENKEENRIPLLFKCVGGYKYCSWHSSTLITPEIHGFFCV